MGVSTNGQLCYGIKFEEDFEFPWGAEEFDGDITEWWRSVNGYVNPNFNPYTEAGEYKPGVTREDPRVDEYFKHSRDWDAAHPVPVGLVNYCSGDYAMYILAVPGVGLSNRRGYPEEFDPSALKVSDEQRAALLEFCKTHKIEHDEEPKWWLSSYWG